MTESSIFSPQYIKKLSSLAAIVMKDGESEKYARQFEKIFEILNSLQSVDTSNIAPLSSPNEKFIVIDKITEKSEQKITNSENNLQKIENIDDIIRNAPGSYMGNFITPKVID